MINLNEFIIEKNSDMRGRKNKVLNYADLKALEKYKEVNKNGKNEICF